ncbi:MAG: serine/threonine-protein phosphatase [Candidatus Auribacter fodinae]|jgi:serine/threonine protein phosphatase PrpC|uniref:Serine/threonine-protein phosphatase n=1 Tax=Candidatus Auribacter fodinae TaxID=2093366 RepID=A0A3A4RBE9_9BACT|nr:MAG: serine/threonine-protein phosphatase [Candidatus Auribacter fodinae]
MKKEIAFFSEQGKREYQQDYCACLTLSFLSLLVVADGNGGEGGFELAQTACKSIVSDFAFDVASGKLKSIDSKDDLKELGLNAINRAAKAVRIAKKRHNWKEAGTTITLVLFTSDFIGTFWIGDSPAYLYDSDLLVQLNHPVHTLAEAMISEGKSREEVMKQPSLNSILTRCAGHKECTPDFNILPLKKPCIVIAGSDGVFSYLSEGEIISTLKAKLNNECEIEDIAKQLVSDAINNGSDDNCSLVAGYFYESAKVITKRITRIFECTI